MIFARPLRLGLLAVCLAFGLKVVMEPKGLEPRQPWIAAEEGDPANLPVELERFAVSEADRAEDVAWIPFAEAAAFVDTTLDGLADLADRINVLRKLATEARAAGEELRSERAVEFERRLAELEIWATAFEFGLIRPLDPESPIVVESESSALRAVRFELPRWNRTAFGFGEDPLGNQSQTEQTLGALDRGYYRVVAAYREVAKLEAWLLAHP